MVHGDPDLVRMLQRDAVDLGFIFGQIKATEYHYAI